MLSPVSMANVSKLHFGDASDEILARKGAYTDNAQNTLEKQPENDKLEKSHTGRNIAIGAGVVIAALALLAVSARKGWVGIKALSDADLADAKWYQPKTWAHYLNKVGNKIAEWTYDPIMNLFKGDKNGVKSVVDDIGEKLDEVVGNASEKAKDVAGKVGEAVEKAVK